MMKVLYQRHNSVAQGGGLFSGMSMSPPFGPKKVKKVAPDVQLESISDDKRVSFNDNSLNFLGLLQGSCQEAIISGKVPGMEILMGQDEESNSGGNSNSNLGKRETSRPSIFKSMMQMVGIRVGTGMLAVDEEDEEEEESELYSEPKDDASGLKTNSKK